MGMTAQLKSALDRTAAMMEGNFYTAKESVLLTVAGDNSEENFDPLVQHYKTTAKFCGWTDKGMVLAGGVSAIGDITGKPCLDEAEKLGKSV